MKDNENIRLLYIDLFCGAGGTSTGVENAVVDGMKCAKVIACVNHDANAIASHSANHPEALHFTEDIRTLDLAPLVSHIRRMRVKYPGALIVLWASLECTNFSKAKGGQPRDPDSRTLAEHLFRYIEVIDPDYIQIENVEEFMSWGKVDELGHPVSRDKGISYLRWVRNVRRYGYDFYHRLLNSADYGAYTSRTRYFGTFAKKGLPIVWPEQTHAKMPGKHAEQGLFPTSDLKPWKAVRDVLDLDDEGESIFMRKRPLVEATLERIYAGLVKFVAGGKDAFLVKWNSMNRNRKYQAPDIDAPCPTVAVQQRIAVATINFLSKYYGGLPEGKNISVNSPAGAVTTKDHHAFISVHYGNGFNRSIDDPAPTLTTKDRFAFVDVQYGNGKARGINAPAPTVTTNPKSNLVVCKPWIMNTNFRNTGSPVDEPAQTITANRKWHYLMNPQFASAGGSIEKPCFTLIARMDKMPPYLIEAESGELQMVIYEDDSPAMKRIKEFMAMYGIVDIRMRMLKILELKRIQGFRDDYVLVGTQAEQKKYLGNAVVTVMAEKLCEELCRALSESRRMAI